MDTQQSGKTGHYFNDRGILEVWYRGVNYGNTIPQEAVDETALKVKQEKESVG